MDIIIESLHPTPKAWLLSSALAPHLESYCAHFRLGRYAATYSVGCVAGLAHFARWMTLCGLAAEQLDAHKVEQFLNEHLPCCDCPKPVRRNHGALRAALGHGGRHTPFFQGYRPQFYFRTTDVTGSIELPAGTEMVMPGDNVSITVALIAPIAMDEGLRFAIREGGRTVGAGVVAKISE